MTTVENIYLTGNFAPVRDELSVTDLPVTGTLPPALAGRFLRNGPNPIAPDPSNYHWFTGDGMLHALELRDGRAVSFRNRWVRTDQACAELGETPPADQPDDVFMGGSTLANTHVVCHAGKILALTETCLPTEVRPDLSTVGRYDFGGALRSPMTAHPKIDPATGEMHFFGYDIAGPPYLRYHVADESGTLITSRDITLPAPVMVHDFAITPEHIVWFDMPVVYDFSLLGQRPFPAAWRPENGTRIGIMPRSGGDADIAWIEIDPCFVYHSANAWDDDGRVVVDVPKYSSAFDVDLSGPADVASVYERWTIDPAVGTLTSDLLDDRGQEFPRINEGILGRRHRYAYATLTEFGDTVDLTGVVKHDHDRATSEVHSFGDDGHAGEPVFVADPDATSEDDGWVLAVVYDGTSGGSSLHVLDATDFAGAPVAVVGLPQRVPHGFHGSWVPDAALV
ncbi:MAG TPA: carotenoid oxygenase family protein [Acidimicrobiia bacterium]|nr:carotenoid oxygenase family protein [Acidimicrobiia bacterium]